VITQQHEHHSTATDKWAVASIRPCGQLKSPTFIRFSRLLLERGLLPLDRSSLVIKSLSQQKSSLLKCWPLSLSWKSCLYIHVHTYISGPGSSLTGANRLFDGPMKSRPRFLELLLSILGIDIGSSRIDTGSSRIDIGSSRIDIGRS